jgi:O-antigen/teichoic acid export membrane protein
VAGALPMANAVLLLPFYLHYLPASEFGALALYLSFSILVQIIITYSYDASLYLYFHEFKKDPEKLSVFVSSAFTFVLIIGTVVSLLLLAAGGFLFHYFFTTQTLEFYPYGLFSVITAVFQSVFKINNTLLQSREKPTLFLWSNLVSFFLVATFTIGGLKFFPDSLMGPIGGKMLAFIISGVWVLYRIYREFGMHFNFALLRTTFIYNSYQFIYQLQQWIINYFDRPLMVMLITTFDLGIYDFTLKCLVVMDFVISGLYNSFFPKILSKSADHAVEGSSVEINRYFHGLTAVIMIMVSGTILVLPILISLFVKKPGYDESINFIPYASLVFLLRGMKFFFGMPYNVMKHSKPLPVIFLIICVVKVMLSYLLIKQFSLYGAIAATLVTSGLEIILLWLWMKGRFSYFFNPLKLIFGPLLLMLAILILEPIFHISFGWQVHVFYVLLASLLLAWLYRKELALFDFQKMIKG